MQGQPDNLMRISEQGFQLLEDLERANTVIEQLGKKANRTKEEEKQVETAQRFLTENAQALEKMRQQFQKSLEV